jgi:hypothetical protein
MWEVEKEIFGASHGEIGAYLLGLWGMPLDLLEVAALHHQPANSVTKGFTPLTAVHVANALEHETNPDKDDAANAAKVDEAYLAQAGFLDQLDTWRKAVTTRNFTKPDPKAKTVVAATAAKSAPVVPRMATAKSAPAKPAATPLHRVPLQMAPTAKSAPSAGQSKLDASWFAQNRKLVFTGMGTAVFGLLVAWLLSGPFKSPADQTAAQAVTNAASNAPQLADSTPATNNTAPAPTAAPDKSKPSNQPPGTMVVRARTADSSSPVVPPAELTYADLKLQGIFFNSKNPTAIISGKTVHTYDRIAGALVAEITPTGVTLEYQNQRKRLTLK